MQHTFFYKDSLLAYQKSGNGNKVLLLFHGFGQDHRTFDRLTESLTKAYTFYVFDLFFHGSSQWNEGETPLEKEMWKEIMLNFFNENKIEKFNVLGFSIGGKFALATLELFPERIEQIYLLAPDGIKTSFWYSLATYPLLLRKFFKSMVQKPGRLHLITSSIRTLHLINPGLLRFAESQMDTEEKRKRVYFSWVVFRHLKFDLRKIASIVNNHSIKLVMIVGKHDKIITVNNMNRLLRQLPHHQLEVLDTGHHGVIAASTPVLVKLSSDP